MRSNFQYDWLCGSVVYYYRCYYYVVDSAFELSFNVKDVSKTSCSELDSEGLIVVEELLTEVSAL